MPDQISDQPRYVDLHELRCGCGEPVVEGSGGFAHCDGSQLCGTDSVLAVELIEGNR
ncbi:MAG: hypothetical protein AB7V44_13630 [Pseudonocardia sp.]